MHFQNRFTACLVRQIYDDATVEAARPQQRAVQYIRLIRRCEHNDALATRETIHFRQYLVERLLLFARAAERDLAPRAPDGIELVDENDGLRVLARLLEEIAYSRSANAYDHLDELRRAHRKEGHAGFACNGSREQRFAGAGCADQQDPFGRASAQARIFFRRLEEVHDFDELVFRLVDTRHIVECDSGIRLLVVASRLTSADAHQCTTEPAALLPRAPIEPEIKADDENRGTETEKERAERVSFMDWHSADLDVMTDQKTLESGVYERWELSVEGVCRARLDVCLRTRRATSDVLIVGRRPAYWRREAAFYAGALAVDGADVAL